VLNRHDDYAVKGVVPKVRSHGRRQRGAVPPRIFIHSTNIVDKGLKVLFFGVFFRYFFVAPPPGNFSTDAIVRSPKSYKSLSQLEHLCNCKCMFSWSNLFTTLNLLCYPNPSAFENSVSLWSDRLMIVTIRETVVTVSGSTMFPWRYAIEMGPSC